MKERQCTADAANVIDILKAEVTYINGLLSLPTLLALANRQPAVDIFNLNALREQTPRNAITLDSLASRQQLLGYWNR